MYFGFLVPKKRAKVLLFFDVGNYFGIKIEKNAFFCN